MFRSRFGCRLSVDSLFRFSKERCGYPLKTKNRESGYPCEIDDALLGVDVAMGGYRVTLIKPKKNNSIDIGPLARHLELSGGNQDF